MKTAKTAMAVVMLLAISGCVQTQTPAEHDDGAEALVHQYDYQLMDAQGRSIDFTDMLSSLKQADVVFVGEYHTHAASHLLQMQLLVALHKQHPQLILSMEQFTRDHQSVVDQYMAGQIGEQKLISDADAWGNYASDYRPLVEYARLHQLPVIAANTPIETVRCVALHGPDVWGDLTEEAQSWLAADLSNPVPAYEEKFDLASSSIAMSCLKPEAKTNDEAKAGKVTHHGHGHGASKKMKRHSFSAQLARDNTMAESIHQALLANPGYRVVHTNGTFHSEEHLGTVEALKRLDPTLNIQVITPVYADGEMKFSSVRGRAMGDYLYLIQPMPERYLQDEACNIAMKHMMKKRAAQSCTLLKETDTDE